MKRLVTREGIVWLALIALTLVGFFNYEPRGSRGACVVLGAGLVKFFLIFYDFMEMRHANRVWLVAMSLFVLALSAAIAVALSAGVVTA